MSCIGYYGIVIDWFVGKDSSWITVYVNGKEIWEKRCDNG